MGCDTSLFGRQYREENYFGLCERQKEFER